MRTIHKFPIATSPGSAQKIELSWDFKPLKLAFQHINDAEWSKTKLQLWVLLNPNGARVPVDFYIFGTGQEIPAGLTYVDTVLDGLMVWHLFCDCEARYAERMKATSSQKEPVK